MEVLDGAELVTQFGRADLADEQGRVRRFIAVHGVLGAAARGGELPRVFLRAGAIRHWCPPGNCRVAVSVSDWFRLQQSGNRADEFAYISAVSLDYKSGQT